MNLYKLLFTSKRSSSCSSVDVIDIVEKAVKFNNKNEITGILIQNGDFFKQYLEGGDQILELFNKIKDDKRHKEVALIDFSKLESERMFHKWNMAYRDIKTGKTDFVTNISNEDVKQFNTIPLPQGSEVSITSFFSRTK